MPFNGSGIFSRLYSWANDAAASIKIRADRMDNEMNGFATGLTNCVTRDGQSPATANLPMGGYKHTNVADATANNEYATLSQVISKGVIYCPTVGGTANAITLSSGLSIASYYAGLTLEFVVGTTNTGATTIALDGMAAKTVKRRATTDLGSTDLIAGTVAVIVYDGTNFQLISMRGIRTTDINDNQVTTAKILDENVTTSKIADGAVTSAKLAAGAMTPSGIISAYAGSTAPTGWQLCHGQSISRTTYASLFTAIGTVYGSGDGSTTFNVPDLRGRVVAGQDDMGGTSANRLTGFTGGVDGDVLGATGGVEAHTLTVPEIPSHSHTISTAGNLSLTSGVAAANSGVNSPTTGSTGGGGAHNNVQPTIILNYIIKE